MKLNYQKSDNVHDCIENVGMNEYPTTWEDSCISLSENKENVLGWIAPNSCFTLLGNVKEFTREENNTMLKKHYDAIKSLLKLLMCRDAWWQKSGWEPNWSDDTYKYCIESFNDDIRCIALNKTSCILAFESMEIRDKFLDSFRDDIEKAKTLL